MRKPRPNKTKFLRPKFSLTPKSGAALLAVLVCLGGAGYVASKKLSASASSLNILCDRGSVDGTSCLNRYRGQSGEAAVVGYNKNFDNNENFGFENLYHMCNSGYVSSTCPFKVGSGLNTRYQGDLIVQIKDYSTGKCVGAYSFDTSEAAEEHCNDSYGNGGGTGTVFTWNVAGGGGTRYYLESKYWSNQLGKPAWLCYLGYPSEARFVQFTSTDFGTRCQWQPVSK